MGKDKLFRENAKLPASLTVPFEVYQQAVAFRDANTHVLGTVIPEQQLDLLGPESEEEGEVEDEVPYIEI